MREILRRKAAYRARRQVHRLAAVEVGLMALLAAALVAAPALARPERAAQAAPSVMGATILGPEAGGYALVALLAFCLGALSASLAFRYRAMSARNGRAERDRDDR